MLATNVEARVLADGSAELRFSTDTDVQTIGVSEGARIHVLRAAPRLHPTRSLVSMTDFGSPARPMVCQSFSFDLALSVGCPLA